MASPSGTPSGGSTESEPQPVIDPKKRKRMQSNRESARRSRMRKQKHLDDLITQVAQLKDEKNQLATTHKITTQQYLDLEAENSMLRSRVMELTTRVHSLNEIITNYYCMTMSEVDKEDNSWFAVCDSATTQAVNIGGGSFLMPWSLVSVKQTQPIMASPDMFPY